MNCFYRSLYAVTGLLICCLLWSNPCSGQRTKAKKDDITYFQPTTSAADSVLTADSIPAFRIQPGTELNIQVSTMNEEADVLYNPRMMVMPVSNPNNPDTRQPAGYLVDSKGFINFPIVGHVNMLNLTTQAAADTLMQRLSKQVNNPFVTVRVVNFQVTVMGEVGRPGVLNVSREKVTLPEAISLSGDLTIFGKRENVLVVRQQNGKRKFGHVDLKDRSVFQSPYYYLQPNDMVYVEPKRSKKAQAGRIFPFLPTVFSGASLLVTIAVLILRR